MTVKSKGAAVFPPKKVSCSDRQLADHESHVAGERDLTKLGVRNAGDATGD